MVREVYTTQQLKRAIRDARNGETILIHNNPGAEYIFEPVQKEMTPDGAALTLFNRHGVTLQGVGNPVLSFITHGNGLAIWNCSNIKVRDVVFRGAGVLRGAENEYSYCLIITHGEVDRLLVRDCGFYDSGSQGIAHMWGPRLTINSTFEGNHFRNIGNYARKSLKYDGAAMAVGGCNNTYLNNHIEDCLRGIEIENPFPPTSSGRCMILGNRIERCRWQSIIITPDGTAEQGKIFHQLFDQITVSNNIIVGTKIRVDEPSNTGIYVTGADGMLITGNQIRDIYNGIGILLVSNQSCIVNCLVSNNRVECCDRTGIQLSPGHVGPVLDNVVRGNLLRKIGGQGIYIEADNTIIDGNDINGCEWEPFYDARGNSTWILNDWRNCKKEPMYDIPVPTSK